MKIIIKILLLNLIIFSFFSCDNEQDTAKPIDPNSKPKATYTIQNYVDTTAEVDEYEFIIDVTLDRPLREDLPFRAYQVGGDADENDFVAIDGVIPAFATTTQVKVKVIKDALPEGDETLTIRVAPFNSVSSTAWDAEHWANVLSPSSPKEEFSFTIQNYVSNDLTIDLAWEVNDTNFVDCDQDLDLYLVDAINTELSHSWFDCPEEVVLPGTALDGDYFVNIDYYAPSDVAADPATDTMYNTKYTLTLTQVGVFSEQFSNEFDDSDSNLYLNWTAYIQFGGDGLHEHVVQITKIGTNYTITQL